MSFVLYHKGLLVADRQCLHHSCNLNDDNYYQLLNRTSHRDTVNKIFTNAKKTIAFGAVGDKVDHFEDKAEISKFCRILEGFITEFVKLKMAKKSTKEIDASKIFNYLRNVELNAIVMSTAGVFLFQETNNGKNNLVSEIYRTGSVAIGSRATALLTVLSLGKKLTLAAEISATVDSLSSAVHGEEEYQDYDYFFRKDLKPFEIKA